jgi:HAD superfamily hydrolase (TIGR01509 family)
VPTILFSGGPQVAAVAFDMDGVIFDTESIYRDATVEALHSLGCADGPTVAEAMTGRTENQCVAILRRTYGPPFPMAEFDRRYRSRRDALLADRAPVNRHVPEILDALRARRMPIALVTNSRRATTVSQMRHADLLQYFQVVVASDDVVSPKPAADVYLYAATRLSTRPGQAVAVEDSAVGVRAAKDAGFYTIQLGQPKGRVYADTAAADLAEVAVLLGLDVEDCGR